MTRVVNGKLVADSVTKQNIEQAKALRGAGHSPSLMIFSLVGDDSSKVYLQKKHDMAERLGITFYLEQVEAKTTEAAIEKIQQALRTKNPHGAIVQLPVADHLDRNAVLDAIPLEKDVDGLSSENVRRFKRDDHEVFVPPVAGAIEEVLEHYQLDVSGLDVAIVGYGRLVGQPAEALFMNMGALVQVCDEFTEDTGAVTREADVIVSGVGKANIITPDMTKNGVHVIDVGFSRVKGELHGDVDPAVSKKADLFCPSPGGVGPVTVAKLFQNVLIATERQENRWS